MQLTADTSTIRVHGVDGHALHPRPAPPPPPPPAGSRPAGAAPPPAAPPVVILHGWGASIEAMGSVTNGLPADLEIVALDLPGFGMSGPPPEPWDVTAYAEYVLAACDELGLERFSLLGHSFGA